MEKFLYFFLHLGVPVLILVLTLAVRAKSRWGIVANSFFKFSALVFLFLWGQYPMVGSFYLRYVLLLIALMVLIKGVQNWRTRPIKSSWYIKILSGLLLVISMFVSFQCVMAIKGKFEPKTEAELLFPLKDGKYYISSGGGTAIINNHFRKYPNAQQYAIDINKMGSLGSVSTFVFSAQTDKHFVFGEEVFCPCSGKVLDAQNDVPDNEKTGMYVDHSFGRGNYVDIDCDGLIVSMSHFLMGSVQVLPGTVVERGQLIAKVGNSGFSQEPHLHIQGARYDQDSTLIGVPVKFNNRWLVRNSIITIQ